MLARCLYFHRLLIHDRIEDFSDYSDPTARDFEHALRRLARKYKFVTTEELVDGIKHGTDEASWLHISFDDGFASTLLAADICRRLKIPLLVFVTSRVVDGYVPWFSRARALLGAGRSLDFRGSRWDTADIEQARRLMDIVKNEIYRFGPDPTAALDAIAREMGALEEDVLPDKHRLLTRDELRQLVSLGAEVGSHGVTHADLTACDDAALSHELQESAAALRSATGVEVPTLSYPDGRFDARVVAATRGCYQAAFAAAAVPDTHGLHAIPREWCGRNIEALGRPAMLGRSAERLGWWRIRLRSAVEALRSSDERAS